MAWISLEGDGGTLTMDTIMEDSGKLGGVKALLIDLAGVLYVGNEAIPGSVEAMKRLRQAGFPLKFLTNTTRAPRAGIVTQLRNMGFEVTEEEILTAATATRSLVESRQWRPHYLIHPDMAEEMGPGSAEPDVVVMGDAGPYFTHEALNKAFRWLMQGKPLLVMAKNRYFRDAEGLVLDMGAYVAALEFAAGIKAEVAGKPAPAFFEAALKALGMKPHEALMIGDDLESDIGGALQAGIPGVLVRTGKYRREDEAHPSIKPAWLAPDFASVAQVLLG